MPFRMRVSRVEDKGPEISVAGELVEGSYMGPEAVLLCGQDGERISAVITDHAMEFPKDWPVRPKDGSTLILNIPKPRAGFQLDLSQLVIGEGTILRNSKRVDLTESLKEPTFWAIWMPLCLDSEEIPEPSLAWGLSSEDSIREYKERFETHWDAGVWPYVRFGWPGDRYIEIEFAAGIEHQTRVWIGRLEGPRVLLGYDSGHFSFPSLRIEEVLQIAERRHGHPAAPLLLLAGAYLRPSDEFPREAVRQWLKDSPGFQMEFMDTVLNQLSRRVVSKLAWEFSEDRGWTNNWRYSQRNPGSQMSILSDTDFHFIVEFFGA